MADSLDNYYYCLGSERFGLWVQVYLGSCWLVLPLPYSGMTLSLLVPALQTGHPGLLGHVSSHWKTKKEYIMSSVNQKPICCREIKKDGEFWTWSLLIRWTICCELSFCQINHYVLWISVVAHYTVKSEGLWFKFLKRNSDFSLYHILRHFYHEFLSGCQNVSHHYWQQSFSGQHSSGWSDYPIIQMFMIYNSLRRSNPKFLSEVDQIDKKQLRTKQLIHFTLKINTVAHTTQWGGVSF